jgi:hypothetical protein
VNVARILMGGALMGMVGIGTAVAVGHLVPSRESTLLYSRDNLLVVTVTTLLALTVAVLTPSRMGLHRAGGVVVLAVVLPSAGVWATYNPVQDAKVIFQPIDTPITQSLDAAEASRSDGVIAANFPGSTLNGQGYRSVVHALPLPQLDKFRQVFPELSESELNYLFNRYSEQYLTEEQRPRGRFATIP